MGASNDAAMTDNSKTHPATPTANSEGGEGAGGQGAEVDHWTEVLSRAKGGERIFWLNHPRVARLHFEKGLIDGLPWQNWVVGQLGRPAGVALELGCGDGASLAGFLRAGVASEGEGIDLPGRQFVSAPDIPNIRFLTADLNQIELEANRYDLIYALQAFHHFEALEHIMAQVNRALTPEGFFILDEFVGPDRFQWTTLQLSVTAAMLGLMPKSLRMYANGVEKREEGRSTPEEVIRVCPSEAIRSSDIVPLFRRNFDVVCEKQLGGTIQHMLYSGIIQNFPDDDSEVDHIIDSVDTLESLLISLGVLPSDFVLLVGRKRASGGSDG